MTVDWSWNVGVLVDGVRIWRWWRVGNRWLTGWQSIVMFWELDLEWWIMGRVLGLNYGPWTGFGLCGMKLDCWSFSIAIFDVKLIVIGRVHAPVHHVTSLEDDGLGSLWGACRKREPLWIVFDVSGTIHLKSHLTVSSHKTIDGRGQRIKLTGNGLRLKECEHVIICNLEFEGGRGHDVDAIQIKLNSKHIWIDRCSLRDYDDGLIDMSRGSTDITVSRCHFLMGPASIFFPWPMDVDSGL
ncbi:hypothetical protein Droror1_Dr00022972 [Drosera rotundifolia]